MSRRPRVGTVILLVVFAVIVGWAEVHLYKSRKEAAAWYRAAEREKVAVALFKEGADLERYREKLGPPDRVWIRGGSKYWYYYTYVGGRKRGYLAVEIDGESGEVVDVDKMVLDYWE